MLKDLIKGINNGLSFIFVIGLMFVYGIGVHTAEEILGENFTGDNVGTGNVEAGSPLRVNGRNIGITVGSETGTRNINILYCIKY